MDPGTSRREGRKRGPIWARLCLILGLVLATAASVTLVGIEMLVSRYTDQIATGNLLGDARKENAGRATLQGPLNILLLGTDYRNDPKLRGTLWRADTIMVLHVPRGHDRAYLLSFSRDTWVEIPPAPTGDWEGGEDKINAAFVHGGNGVGGYQLLAATLSDLMDVEFDSGAVINFYGFVRVVEVLGGVELCIETPPGTTSFTSIHPPYRTFEEGCRHYNGHEALDYVRQRKQFPDGDNARMRHQQQFLRALLERAREQGVHTDLGKLDRVIRAAGDALMLDESIPVADLAFTLRGIHPKDLVAIRVPAEGHMGPQGWYAELVDPADSLFRAVRRDTVAEWVKEHPEYVNPLT